ncbi:DNA N-glycosylase and apurinic/apyrimidinic (AP) lyase [Nowakowskiella sp. JEL0407]|nr:DNA N-glycosylase and apurinic/apyrimidinic (AP) lyase [Nowakowskiella sp. JEL0407]
MSFPNLQKFFVGMPKSKISKNVSTPPVQDIEDNPISSTIASTLTSESENIIKDIPTMKPPKNWELVFSKICEFRKVNIAPVDSIGCSRLAKSKDPKARNTKFETLTALLLSSQTKDEQTSIAVRNLQEHGLSVESILQMTEAEIKSCIGNVGFHNKKATYLKKIATILAESYDSDIPSTLEGLQSLPGMGPKMSHLCMQSAWFVNSGIGVDTHVFRISKRLGWAKGKNPEEVRMELESWLPETHWKEVNELLVGFGQVHCSAKSPKCADCPVKDLCPKIGLRKGH